MSVEKEIQITIRIKAETVFRLKDKVTLLDTFSRLGADDQSRILQIIDNPKALKGLEKNWNMLKMMF
jgi:hypothetical protein